jgi:hypothetical protein
MFGNVIPKLVETARRDTCDDDVKPLVDPRHDLFTCVLRNAQIVQVSIEDGVADGVGDLVGTDKLGEVNAPSAPLRGRVVPANVRTLSSGVSCPANDPRTSTLRSRAALPETT